MIAEKCMNDILFESNVWLVGRPISGSHPQPDCLLWMSSMRTGVLSERMITESKAPEHTSADASPFPGYLFYIPPSFGK